MDHPRLLSPRTPRRPPSGATAGFSFRRARPPGAIDALETDIARLDAERKRLNPQLETAKARLTALRQRLMGLQAGQLLAAKAAEYADAEAALADARQRLTDAIAGRLETKTALDKISSRINGMDIEIERRNRDLPRRGAAPRRDRARQRTPSPCPGRAHPQAAPAASRHAGTLARPAGAGPARRALRRRPWRATRARAPAQPHRRRRVGDRRGGADPARPGHRRCPPARTRLFRTRGLLQHHPPPHHGCPGRLHRQAARHDSPIRTQPKGARRAGRRGRGLPPPPPRKRRLSLGHAGLEVRFDFDRRARSASTTARPRAANRS